LRLAYGAEGESHDQIFTASSRLGFLSGLNLSCSLAGVCFRRERLLPKEEDRTFKKQPTSHKKRRVDGIRAGGFIQALTRLVQVCPNGNPEKPPSFVCVGCEVPLVSRLFKNRRGRGDWVLENQGLEFANGALRIPSRHIASEGGGRGACHEHNSCIRRGGSHAHLCVGHEGTRDEDRQMCRIVRVFCIVYLRLLDNVGRVASQ